MGRKKLITVLIVIAVVLAAVAGGLFYMAWYQNTHVFVEKDAYPADSTYLDLTDKAITPAYYGQLQSLLPNCEIRWNVSFQGGSQPSDTEEISVKTLSDADISLLKAYFPKLKRVNAAGCTDYAALELLTRELPDVTVSYAVDLGGSQAEPDSTELVLEPENFTLETLEENLPYLGQLKSLTFRNTRLTLGDVQQLRNDFPTLEITYTVDILGTEYSEGETALDLSGIDTADVEAVSGQLMLFPDLANLELCGSDGTSALSKEDAKRLIQAAPQATAHYVFDFYGTQLSTDMEEVVLKNKRIGDEGEQELRLTLELLSSCKRFVLDNCRFSNDVLAKVREDYRSGPKVVWRVWFGDGSCLTDVDVIRCTYDLKNSNCSALYYCEDARYMDIGHDDTLTTIEFMAGMKSMEYLIVSGAPIRDLTPLSNCKKLKVLEIANCGYVADLSPLAECDSLIMLNISNSNVSDISALQDLNLTMFSAVGKPSRQIPQEQKDAFAEKHPDCWTTYKGFEYGPGWRYDRNNKQLPWYQEIADAFGYPHPLNNGGWYFQA